MADPKPVDAPQDELRARDLLPPDPPPPDAGPRRIAERRVAGHATVRRLLLRRARRPAGNSRRFWARMEEDDPFLPPPATPRAPEVGHDQLYPAERLGRLPQPAPSRSAAPPPQPTRPSAPPRTTSPSRPSAPPRPPEPVHTPEPRPAPAPSRPIARSAAAPPPPAAAPPTPAPPVPAPPPVPQAAPRAAEPSGNRTGRVRIQRATRTPAPSVEAVPKPAEVRAAKRESRQLGGKSAPPPLRSLDEVLGILGELRMAEKMYEAGITGPLDTDRVDTPPPRPVTPPRAPTAPRPAAPVDRTPPRPAAVDRTPPRPATGASPRAENAAEPPRPEPQAGLDDLFGGAPDDRVRIGRRTRPSGPVIETRED